MLGVEVYKNLSKKSVNLSCDSPVMAEIRIYTVASRIIQYCFSPK